MPEKVTADSWYAAISSHDFEQLRPLLALRLRQASDLQRRAGDNTRGVRTTVANAGLAQALPRHQLGGGTRLSVRRSQTRHGSRLGGDQVNHDLDVVVLGGATRNTLALLVTYRRWIPS
jgi:hypothetical protein